MKKSIEPRPETTQYPQTKDGNWEQEPLRTWVENYMRDSYLIAGIGIGIFIGLALGVLIYSIL